MEPNTTYRPPFYLGDKFIDGNSRTFEIIETHWGLPGTEAKEQPPRATVELLNGHKITFYAPPNEAALIKVSIQQEGGTGKRSTQPVTQIQQLINERKIVMI